MFIQDTRERLYMSCHCWGPWESQSILPSGWSCGDIQKYGRNQSSKISVILISLCPQLERLMYMSERHGRWMWRQSKVGKMNNNNGVGLHSNQPCIILWICVWVYRVMDTIYPPFLYQLYLTSPLLENTLLIARDYCYSPESLNPCAVLSLELH